MKLIALVENGGTYMKFQAPTLFLWVLLLTLGLPNPLVAAETATLTGRVIDPSEAVIPEAQVEAVNVNTNITYATVTNDLGLYVLPNLPPGSYRLFVRKDGFRTIIKPDIILHVQDTVAQNFTMALGSMVASITVEGGAPLTNTQSAAVTTVVDRQFVANIPLNGRSFQSLITLSPGVILAPSPNSGFNFDGQFSVNGQRPTANAFTVDGISANFGAAAGFGPGTQTSGNNPAFTAFGTTQSLVSVDALEEFKNQTSTYSAEHGRQPGGQISIVTRSGTNEFHGSVFDYFRNDKLDASDWFANANGQPKAALRQNDFGATLGGPVLLPGYNGRNRTFFFFSYEGLRLRLPVFTVTNVPTLALRQQASAGVQPILNAFPLPNGTDLGNGFAEFSTSYSNPSTLNATSIRIDHMINSKLTLFGRYNQAPSHSASRSTRNLSLIRFQSVDIKTVTLGLSANPSPRISNELRVNWSDNVAFSRVSQSNFGGATPIARSVLVPSQFDSISAFGGSFFFLSGFTARTPGIDFLDRALTPQRQVNVVDSVSYNVGAHQLKFGFDFRRLTPVYNVNSYASEFDFFSLEDILTSTPGFVLVEAGIPVKPRFLNFSAFVQDTWAASSRLTLNFGVRWEVNPPPSEANGNLPLAVTQISDLSTMLLAPRGTKLWKTTYNNFAPRFGVAYQLSQQPGRETVVRAGFGVFYDTGNDQSAFPFAVFPFTSRAFPGTVTLPVDPNLVAPPPIPILQPTITPPFGTMHVFDPNLKLPYTLQWNVSIGQAVGKNQVFRLSYVGANGRRLLQQELLIGVGSINPLFTNLRVNTNNASSDYQALQTQFQRRLTRGLQALASYTWSHTIDDDSTSSTSRVAKRGNSNFDVRHNFAAAVTYDIPSPQDLGAANAIFGGWSIDTTAQARSALPVDPIATFLISPADGSVENVRPDLIPGVPLYIHDETVPGGRVINRAAFSVPAAGQSGTLGRNVLRGLPAWQLDLALRKQFRLGETLGLQFRAEAFNIFNHPNFGTIQTRLTAANFGQATDMLNRQLGGISSLYQIGGPRSIQFVLKVQF